MGLVANDRHDGSCSRISRSTTEPHLGFRAIYETANICFLSKSHLGECLGDEMATVLASRDNVRQMTPRRLVEAINNPGFP